MSLSLSPAAQVSGAQARRAAMRRLVVKRLASGFGERAAFVLAIGVTATFAAWMLALYLATPADAADVLAVRGVGWLCVLAGGVATLALTRDLGGRDEADGIAALLRARGHDANAVRRTHLHATIRVIAGTLLGPALVLALLGAALSRSSDVLWSRLLLVGGVGAFVLAVSCVLGVGARWAVSFAQARARWLLIALVLGPELLSRAGANVPSLPALFGALLAQVARLGVAFL